MNINFKTDAETLADFLTKIDLMRADDPYMNKVIQRDLIYKFLVDEYEKTELCKFNREMQEPFLQQIRETNKKLH